MTGSGRPRTTRGRLAAARPLAPKREGGRARWVHAAGARWLSLSLAGAALTLSGCAGTPQAVPTIGSPQPTPTPTASAQDRSTLLARQWGLTGAALPSDWPDVPLPEGSRVVTAYAIGAEPRRTWTATFAADEGTALDIAEPVVAALRERGYMPIAEYVGDAATNTGLYSFAADTFAVYVVLGEDDGQPNVVMTVRGSPDDTAGAPDLDGSIAPIRRPRRRGRPPRQRCSRRSQAAPAAPGLAAPAHRSGGSARAWAAARGPAGGLRVLRGRAGGRVAHRQARAVPRSRSSDDAAPSRSGRGRQVVLRPRRLRRVHRIDLVGEVVLHDLALDLEARGQLAVLLGQVAVEDRELLDGLPAVQLRVQRDRSTPGCWPGPPGSATWPRSPP